MKHITSTLITVEEALQNIEELSVFSVEDEASQLLMVIPTLNKSYYRFYLGTDQYESPILDIVDTRTESGFWRVRSSYVEDGVDDWCFDIVGFSSEDDFMPVNYHTFGAEHVHVFMEANELLSSSLYGSFDDAIGILQEV